MKDDDYIKAMKMMAEKLREHKDHPALRVIVPELAAFTHSVLEEEKDLHPMALLFALGLVANMLSQRIKEEDGTAIETQHAKNIALATLTYAMEQTVISRVIEPGDAIDPALVRMSQH